MKHTRKPPDNPAHKMSIDIPADMHAEIAALAKENDLGVGPTICILLDYALSRCTAIVPAVLANVPPASRAAMEKEWKEVTK